MRMVSPKKDEFRQPDNLNRSATQQGFGTTQEFDPAAPRIAARNDKLKAKLGFGRRVI